MIACLRLYCINTSNTENFIHTNITFHVNFSKVVFLMMLKEWMGGWGGLWKTNLTEICDDVLFKSIKIPATKCITIKVETNQPWLKTLLICIGFVKHGKHLMKKTPLLIYDICCEGETTDAHLKLTETSFSQWPLFNKRTGLLV